MSGCIHFYTQNIILLKIIITNNFSLGSQNHLYVIDLKLSLLNHAAYILLYIFQGWGAGAGCFWLHGAGAA